MYITLQLQLCIAILVEVELCFLFLACFLNRYTIIILHLHKMEIYSTYVLSKKRLLYKHVPYTLKHMYKQAHTFPGLWFIGNLRLVMLYTCMCNIFHANVDVKCKKKIIRLSYCYFITLCLVFICTARNASPQVIQHSKLALSLSIENWQLVSRENLLM